jgi:hypothetical protein
MLGSNVIKLVLAAAAFAAAVWVLRWYVRREPDRFVRRVIAVGFVAKLAGTLAYYFVIGNIYGAGDVTGYVKVGRRLAPIIRSGTMPLEASQTGTRFMEFLTGVAFAIFGSNELVGYVVFSMLSFIGMLAFLKALQLALPHFDARRYAVLVLLLPTMLFWPSTIGKDAWLVFTLGLGSYGVARILTRRRFGYPLTGLSVLAMGAVRPHMAALFALSFALAYLLRLNDPTVKRNLAAWATGLALVLAGVAYTATTFSEEQGRGEAGEDASTIDQIRADTDEIFERTDKNTSRGGGEFESRPVRSPGDFVHALITVPFRPFVVEAHNQQAQLISLESLLLMGLVIVAFPRFARWTGQVMRSPYLAFVSIYSVGFIIAFSNVANFGILTRQRSQLLPFLLVLLVLRSRRTADGPVGSRTPDRARTSPSRVLIELPSVPPT